MVKVLEPKYRNILLNNESLQPSWHLENAFCGFYIISKIKSDFLSINPVKELGLEIVIGKGKGNFQEGFKVQRKATMQRILSKYGVIDLLNNGKQWLGKPFSFQYATNKISENEIFLLLKGNQRDFTTRDDDIAISCLNTYSEDFSQIINHNWTPEDFNNSELIDLSYRFAKQRFESKLWNAIEGEYPVDCSTPEELEAYNMLLSHWIYHVPECHLSLAPTPNLLNVLPKNTMVNVRELLRGNQH